jgi:hypothetical protein
MVRLPKIEVRLLSETADVSDKGPPGRAQIPASLPALTRTKRRGPKS